MQVFNRHACALIFLPVRYATFRALLSVYLEGVMRRNIAKACDNACIERFSQTHPHYLHVNFHPE
jgi:hypothetical protein